MPMAQLQQLAAQLAERKARGRRIELSYEAWDSLDRLGFLTAVEDHFGIEFSDAEITGIHSLEDMDRVVEARLVGLRQTSAPAEASLPGSEAWTKRKVSPSVIHNTHGFFRSFVQSSAMSFFRLLYPITATGLENIPARGPCILIANHSSHLDGPLMLSCLKRRERDLLFLAARDYFFAGQKLGAIAAWILPIVPLERWGDIAALRQNLLQLNACKDSGKIIVFFPEGTRSRDGRLQRLREGFGHIAIRLDIPVIPCWLEGCFEALPPRARFPRRRPLRMIVGKPLPRLMTREDFVTQAHRALAELGGQQT